MTVRESGAGRLRRLAVGDRRPGPGAAAELVANLDYKVVHVLTPVIARDVGMQVLPQSLDPVVVRAIRRQEVQPDPPAEPGQRRLGDLAGMDPVVVQD